MRTPKKLVMISEEMSKDEVLRQAAEHYSEALIASLPSPEECNHKFFRAVRRKDSDVAPS